MCWYSQHEGLKTRRAIEGEELLVRDFAKYGSWLASGDDLETPVCLASGCKLKIGNIPDKLQKRLNVESEALGEFKTIHHEFSHSLWAKVFLSSPKIRFDVVLFSSGRFLEISKFVPGMTVDVLSDAIFAPIGTGTGEDARSERAGRKT
jgi:hypothetical protein